MLTDVYSHLVTDSGGDGWREFWLDAYETAAKRRPGVVSVWSRDEVAA